MRAIQTVWRTIKSWSCKRPRAIKPMFSIPRPHTYTWEDKQARVLDPEGLASMNLGTQDLKTRVKDALNLSCGLAWWKCRFKWEVSIRTMPQNSNSRRRTSATISKKATVSRRSKRRTNTSITRYMSWTNTRSTRSMPTITTKPTRKGVKESIDKARSCARFTSLHAMRKARAHRMRLARQ